MGSVTDSVIEETMHYDWNLVVISLTIVFFPHIVCLVGIFSSWLIKSLWRRWLARQR